MPIHKYMNEHVLFPAMERYKDNRIRALLSELQQSQYADIASIQTQRLTRLLLHCKEHVPAYRAILPAASQIKADPFRVLRTAVPLCLSAPFSATPPAILRTTSRMRSASRIAPAGPPESPFTFL